MNKWLYFIIPFWVALSMWIAFRLTNLAVSKAWFNFVSQEHISQEAFSTIFAVIFTVLAGIGSVLMTLFIHFQNFSRENKKEKIQNFPALEPRTVEEFFLDGLEHDSLCNVGEQDLGKTFYFNKGHFSSEFILVKKGHKFFSFARNISRIFDEDDPLLFVLINRGNTPVVPKSLYILYKKKDIGGTQEEKLEYTNMFDKYYIKEELGKNGIVVPGEDQIFIYASEKGYKLEKDEEHCSFDDYQNFYKEIKQTKEFFVVVEFSTLDNSDTTISRAYKATLSKKELKNSADVYCIENFRPVLRKKYLDDFVGSHYPNKILTVD